MAAADVANDTFSLYILHEIQNFRRLRWKYFDDTWVYFEIVNYLLFIGAFIMRFQPFYAVYRDGFPPRPDEFINFETPMFAIVQWKNIMSLNCVISWLRLFKYLQEVPFMQVRREVDGGWRNMTDGVLSHSQSRGSC